MEIKLGVAPDDGDTFTGLCSCGFATKFWPSQEVAADRLLQHKAEHDGGRNEDGTIASPMELLSDFRDRHGLVRDGDRAVFPAGTVEVVVEGKGE